jgi:hypothetical protein
MSVDMKKYVESLEEPQLRHLMFLIQLEIDWRSVEE